MAKYSLTIHSSWYPLFAKWEQQLDNILADVYPATSNIKTYPPRGDIFNAFCIPVTEIKLVLLGQDCYHGEGQAMGLAFSTPKGVKIPPSLVNIFKELSNEFPERNYVFTTGDLTPWTTQEGIFLLNSALTVRQSTPLSHIKKWETFTDDVIKFTLEKNPKCVFLLLGNYAKDKAKFILADKYGSEKRIVRGVHPSPLSAHNGFFNSGIFQKVETLLGKINWQN